VVDFFARRSLVGFKYRVKKSKGGASGEGWRDEDDGARCRSVFDGEIQGNYGVCWDVRGGSEGRAGDGS